MSIFRTNSNSLAFRSSALKIWESRNTDDGRNRNVPDGNQTGLDRLPAKGRPQERKLDWQIGRRKLCPGLCPNGCLPSTNTVTYGETRRETSRGSTKQAYTPQRRCFCFGWWLL